MPRREENRCACGHFHSREPDGGDGGCREEHCPCGGWRPYEAGGLHRGGTHLPNPHCPEHVKHPMRRDRAINRTTVRYVCVVPGCREQFFTERMP